MQKKKLIQEIARQLYVFDYGNKDYKINDSFTIDGETYSIKQTVLDWMKENGYTSLVEMMDGGEK